MKPFRGPLFGLIFLLLGTLTVEAASLTCPAIVEAALSATTSACATTGRNQACYGNLTLQTQFRDGVTPVEFNKIGDLVNVSTIKSLHLSSLSLDDSSWGMALMKIQANLPDALPGQNVTFVLFGNVQIDNQVDTLTTLPMTALQSANVRSRPSTQGAVLLSLKRTQAVVANGRLADNSWIRVQLPDNTNVGGWVSAALLRGTGDLSSLAVVDASTPVLGPMQAFYFTSAIGDTPCAEVPPNGLLVQSPKSGKVNLMVNGAQITFGSTAFIQAQPGGSMTISVIEGDVTVQVNGVGQNVPAGTSTRIPLDATGTVSGAPSFPQPYDQTALSTLPITVLPDTIAIASPLTASQVQAAISASEGLPMVGTWRDDVGTPSACNARYPAPFNVHIAVDNDGAVLDLGGGYIYDRTAPGIYVLRGLPRDNTKVGLLNIRETEVLNVLSPTEIRIDATDFIPSQNCRLSLSSPLHYIGP